MISQVLFYVDMLPFWLELECVILCLYCKHLASHKSQKFSVMAQRFKICDEKVDPLLFDSCKDRFSRIMRYPNKVVAWDILLVQYFFQWLKGSLSGVCKRYTGGKRCLMRHSYDSKYINFACCLLCNSYCIFQQPVWVFRRIWNKDAIVFPLKISFRRHYRSIMLNLLLESVHPIEYKANHY